MYVVTFDPRPIAGRGSVDQLKRMTLTAARRLVHDAAPYRGGRIIDVDTLEVIS